MSEGAGTFTRSPEHVSVASWRSPPAASSTRTELVVEGDVDDERDRVDSGLERVVVDVEDDVELGVPVDVVVVGGTGEIELEELRGVGGLIEVEEEVEPEEDVEVEVRSGSRAPPGAVLITFRAVLTSEGRMWPLKIIMWRQMTATREQAQKDRFTDCPSLAFQLD